MADSRSLPGGQIARLDRRRLIGAVVSGGLLGSAWAASFRDAVLAGDEAHVTVARTATALGVLIEHRGHRVMLIDAADAPAATTVTELSTGFLRQRIDALLLPVAGFDALPPDYAERWRVRHIWTLPDRPGVATSSLAGKTLRIGDLAIDTDALPIGAWRTGAPGDSAWYVGASFGRARLVVTSDGNALERLPLDAAMANAVVCLDAELELGTVPTGIALLAVPVETADRVPAGPRIMPLSRDASVAFRLRHGRVETP